MVGGFAAPFCIPVHEAFRAAQSASQLGRVEPSDGGNIEKHASPVARAKLFSWATVADEQSVTNKTLMQMSLKELAERKRMQLRLERNRTANQKNYPLVAREFINRGETIATAFSREAWTSKTSACAKISPPPPDPRGRKTAS